MNKATDAIWTLGATLVARKLDGPGEIVQDHGHTPPGNAYIIAFPDGNHVYVYAGSFPVVPGHPHFPYGQTVEPDHL